jgi:hypothetical protein
MRAQTDLTFLAVSIADCFSNPFIEIHSRHNTVSNVGKMTLSVLRAIDRVSLIVCHKCSHCGPFWSSERQFDVRINNGSSNFYETIPNSPTNTTILLDA